MRKFFILRTVNLFLFSHFDRKISLLLVKNIKQVCQDCTSFYGSRGSGLRISFPQKGFFQNIFILEQRISTFGNSFPSSLSKLIFTSAKFLKKKRCQETWIFGSWLNKTFSESVKFFPRGSQNWSQLLQTINCGNENFISKYFDILFPILRNNFSDFFAKHIRQSCQVCFLRVQWQIRGKTTVLSYIISKNFPTVIEKFPDLWQKKQAGLLKRNSICPKELFEDFLFWKTKKVIAHYWIWGQIFWKLADSYRLG